MVSCIMHEETMSVCLPVLYAKVNVISVFDGDDIKCENQGNAKICMTNVINEPRKESCSITAACVFLPQITRVYQMLVSLSQ